MDAETPATLEIGWLRNDTYCEGYAEVGLGWFFWVKRIIKLLEDSVSLITINHHLDGALEKLIVTNNGDETNRKTIMDSVIRIQKMIEEAQYRFTKLAAALNDSSRESIVGNNSGSQVDGGLMFNTFLKTLSQKTSSELRDVDEGIVEALKSVGDVLIEKEPKRETQSDVLADREMKTLLLGVAGCGVATFLVAILQNQLGVSFTTSVMTVLVGVASIGCSLYFGLKMRWNRAIENKKETKDNNDSVHTSLEDATFQAAHTFSLLNKQLELIMQEPPDENEMFYQSAIGHSLVECLEKIEAVSRQYLDLSEENYGSLDDRNHYRDLSF